MNIVYGARKALVAHYLTRWGVVSFGKTSKFVIQCCRHNEKVVLPSVRQFGSVFLPQLIGFKSCIATGSGVTSDPKLVREPTQSTDRLIPDRGTAKRSVVLISKPAVTLANCVVPPDCCGTSIRMALSLEARE